MFRSAFVSSALVALVTVPGFLVGQKLRQGDSSGALLMAIVLTIVVLIASAIMRQGDRDAAPSDTADARDRS
jgi:membrane protein DedA with SNARE-associated domain